MNIRHARTTDAAKIYSLLKREKRVAYTRELVDDLIAAKRAYTLVLLDNKTIVGAVAAREEGKKSLWLYYVIVEKKYRYKGFASFLIQTLFSEAKAHGLKRIATDTPDVTFFSKFGFKQVGRIPKWYETKDQIIMFRKL